MWHLELKMPLRCWLTSSRPSKCNSVPSFLPHGDAGMSTDAANWQVIEVMSGSTPKKETYKGKIPSLPWGAACKDSEVHV